MRDKRKRKRVDHIQRYKHVLFWGNIIYSICLIIYFAYTGYYIYSLINTLKSEIGGYSPFPLPYTEVKYIVMAQILLIAAIIEWVYESLCKSRYDKITEMIEMRKAIRG